MKYISKSVKQPTQELIELHKQSIELDELLEFEPQSHEDHSNESLINPTIGIYIVQKGRFELINLQNEAPTE